MVVVGVGGFVLGLRSLDEISLCSQHQSFSMMHLVLTICMPSYTEAQEGKKMFSPKGVSDDGGNLLYLHLKPVRAG